MNELEKTIDQIVSENVHRITNAMLLQIVEEISGPIIEAIAEEMKIHYEQVQIHFMSVMRKFEEKLLKDRKNAD